MGERVAYSFVGFVIRCLFVILLCCLIGPTRCSTTRGGGQERGDVTAEKLESIPAKAEKVKSTLNNPNATAKERQEAAELLDWISDESTKAATTTRQLGKDVDHNKEIADDSKADAQSYRVIVWIARGAVVILILLAIAFRGKIISFFTRGGKPES